MPLAPMHLIPHSHSHLTLITLTHSHSHSQSPTLITLTHSLPPSVMLRPYQLQSLASMQEAEEREGGCRSVLWLPITTGERVGGRHDMRGGGMGVAHA